MLGGVPPGPSNPGPVQKRLVFHTHVYVIALACEQALQDALTAGREKEGELVTKSLEFEYLHRKSRCEKLIGGDDISNDVITVGTFFQCLFTFALVSASQAGSFISIFAATKVNRMLRQYLGPGGALEGTLDRGENRQNLTLFKKENARFATLLKQKTFL